MKASARRTRWLLLVAMVIVVGVLLFFLRQMGVPTPRNALVYALRVGIVASALVAWFISQSLIGARSAKPGEIADGVHDLTAPLNRYLQTRPRLVNGILIASSLFIDLFAVFLIGLSILGPTLRPFVALLILFILRQTCQAVCALPVPPAMIWRSPGVPSLLVTYEVANDFFFSGHTSIAVLGAIEAARILPWWAGVVAGVVAFLEASVVLTLRAHYTMDVVAAAFAAFFALSVADWIYALL
ncbi:MAG: hypothetical protein HZB26_26445 [Candidatus Hydrogenedentes bacterium]|nr:hypothetical protein [Candidatus Hydrogenedentota bacterium]